MKSARFLVTKELSLDGEPGGAGGGALGAPGEDDVDKIVGEGAVEPISYDAVHPRPVGGGMRRAITEDVILQLVLP